MSTSTDAIFGFGWISDEECDYFDGCEDDELGELNDVLDAAVETEQRFGVTIGYHCSGDCPMPYLAICRSVVIAHRGHPALKSPDVTERQVAEWPKKISDAIDFLHEKHRIVAERLRIPRSNAVVGYFLCSKWD